MDRRKIRKLPPIIVSLVASAIFFSASIASISNEAAARIREEQEPTVTQQTMAETVPATESHPALMIPAATTASTAEPDATYDSLIKSRDWDGDDSLMLMKIAMAEAEGECTEGKALVMLAVLNRVWTEEFPNTIEEVIFQPRQFSTTAVGGRYYTTEPDEDCARALELVMNGWDESYGALYFESCKADSWHSENLEYLYQVGNHRFYR